MCFWTLILNRLNSIFILFFFFFTVFKRKNSANVEKQGTLKSDIQIMESKSWYCSHKFSSFASTFQRTWSRKDLNLLDYHLKDYDQKRISWENIEELFLLTFPRNTFLYGSALVLTFPFQTKKYSQTFSRHRISHQACKHL